MRLLVDLDICSQCEECGSVCSYVEHPRNNGIVSVREMAHFAVHCRRCDDAPCVASCPWQALELQPYNALKRYMMRCTSCKSCSQGCPFGVIYTEVIPYAVSRCDVCVGRLGPGEKPICLESCSHGGVRYGEFDEDAAQTTYRISDHIVVKTAFRWEREPVPAEKR